MKKSKIQAVTIVVIIIIFIIVANLYPLITQSGGYERRTPGLSNIKQLGVATIIYTTDYDDRYPHATAMPGLRASIFPYCKSNSLFQPTTQSASPEFNFNYAGTTSTQVPIGYTQPLNPSDTTVWYALSTMKYKPGVF
ncbi:MAG: hypothetical protein ACKVQS_10000, partial [Fimbriimonadaceae bacterium]